MNAGWQIKPLGDISTIAYGYTAKAVSEIVGPKFLRITDVQNGRVDWNNVPYCPIDAADHQKHKLETGNIVFARTGATTGKSFLIENPPDAVCASYLIKVSKLSEAINPRFLSLYFNTDQYWNDIEAGTEGAAQGGFNASKLKALSIPIPPLDEQKQIVATLDAAFEGLTRAKENAEANLQNARELFSASLLSVFSEFEHHENQSLLKEISSDFGRGKSKHRPRNDPLLYDGPYPFVQTGDVRSSVHMITDFKQTYSEAGLAQSKLWPVGTLCITIAANIAETAILSFEACFPDSIIGVVPDPSKTSSRYLEYLLQYFQKRLQARGGGAAQHNINLKTFETEYFPFPSLPDQERAIDRLDAAARSVAELEEKYSSAHTDLADLRQSLLQKAFAGELT